LYIGRTRPGVLQLQSITIQGADQNLFTLAPVSQTTLGQGEWLKLGVMYKNQMQVPIVLLDAKIVIKNNVNGTQVIKIVGGG
jgi:hypothetical protein